jgi:hypothetical protein
VNYERLEELPERFRQEYAKLYGPRDDEAALEVISVARPSVGTTRKANAGVGRRSRGRQGRAGCVRIDVDGVEYDCPVYVRSRCRPDGRPTARSSSINPTQPVSSPRAGAPKSTRSARST